jgi:hypothetical protein
MADTRRNWTDYVPQSVRRIAEFLGFGSPGPRKYVATALVIVLVIVGRALEKIDVLGWMRDATQASMSSLERVQPFSLISYYIDAITACTYEPQLNASFCGWGQLVNLQRDVISLFTALLALLRDSDPFSFVIYLLTFGLGLGASISLYRRYILRQGEWNPIHFVLVAFLTAGLSSVFALVLLGVLWVLAFIFGQVLALIAFVLVIWRWARDILELLTRTAEHADRAEAILAGLAGAAPSPPPSTPPPPDLP